MKTIRKKHFERQTIKLDMAFENCTFLDCSIVFDGASHKLIGCKFANSKFALEGHALTTLQFLRGLWENGGRNVVEDFGLDYTGRALRFV